MLKKIFILENCILVLIIAFLGIELYKNSPKEVKVDVDYYLSLPAFEQNNQDAWYMKNNVVVHGAGSIDGLKCTNSKEALDNTLEHNIYTIEIDFEISSDNKLVCYHEPADVSFPTKTSYTYDEFKNIKIKGKYTPLTGEDIFEYMKKYPELYIVIDTKNEDYLGVIQKIVNEADEDILNRFIIQCYYPDDKEKISNIYNFPDENYLFTAYMYTRNPYVCLQVCMDKNINVLVMPFIEEFYSEEIIEMFNSKNIHVYFHTINRLDMVEYCLDNNVHGIYTDYLYAYDN